MLTVPIGALGRGEDGMARLHLLGTGAALADASRTTTMLALEGRDGTVLIDCGGDAVQRLLAHGLDLHALRALIVTHEHADHVAGVPLLMERLWLAGRREPLPVYGIASAVAQARRSHDAFDTASWPEYPGVRYVEIPYEPHAPVMTTPEWRITASPGIHSVPSIGLRIEDRRGGGVCAYSGDTAYAEAIVELARGADLLVHEAGTEAKMHTLPTEAARVALSAGAPRLVLVHIPPGLDGMLHAARGLFPDLEVGEDGRVLEF
jgi:ribonuclease Z